MSFEHVFLNKYSAIFLQKLLASSCLSTLLRLFGGNLKSHHDISSFSWKHSNGSMHIFRTSSSFVSIRHIIVSITGFNFFFLVLHEKQIIYKVGRYRSKNLIYEITNTLGLFPQESQTVLDNPDSAQ